MSRKAAINKHITHDHPSARARARTLTHTLTHTHTHTHTEIGERTKVKIGTKEDGEKKKTINRFPKIVILQSTVVLSTPLVHACVSMACVNGRAKMSQVSQLGKLKPSVAIEFLRAVGREDDE